MIRINNSKGVFLVFLFLNCIVFDIQAVLINYDFASDNYNGISAENANLWVNSGELTVNISQTNESWKARLHINVNQNIYTSPILYFRYKMANIAAAKKAGLAITLKIDGVYNEATDQGIWRLYPILYN